MIKIPKVFEVIPLRDYSDQFGELVVEVWVNPPRAVGMRRVEILKKSLAPGERDEDALNRELFGWYAEIWSQGEKGEHWTAEEAWQAFEQSPDFIRWLIERTNGCFEEHREKTKKA